ncbi:MAG TPA: hypothetical protein VIF15_05340 [Polyangiaceae bacterium]
MPVPVRLEPRGNRAAPLVFKGGAHPPYAIRWYGVTSLFGHFRNLVATAIASESVDSRDWMRPLDADEMLEGVLRVLGIARKGTLLESLDRPLWIDWVADTGDDRDVSQAVGRMLFAEYTVEEEGGPLTLPRGDVLLIGGDTAYPVATAEEIYRRVVQPWNEVLREIHETRERPRVLLGIPGNHDWYDGLDGFARLFRRRAAVTEPEARPESTRQPRRGRKVGLLARGLHLDEVGGALEMVADAAKTTRAIWRGTSLRRRRRLTLKGYEAVQESSFWALPLAPGLDLWGVDRQLRQLDYRQRTYFKARRRVIGEGAGIWFVAPDPAIAFGEGWDLGARMLAACKLSLERDRVLFQCGDMHQYERRVVGRSLHVIAGGGGAFLHGTRIVPDPRPAAAAYPDAATTRRLALQVPLRLALGRAGYLVHILAALVASIELAAGWHDRQRLLLTSLAVSAAIAWVLYAIAGHQRAHPRRVLAIAVPFGLALGLLPPGLWLLLHDAAHVVPALGRDTAVMIVYAFAGSFLFGVFLTLCALGGLEMQQVFTVLGHPGFKHLVRMRVSPDGTIDAWAIGKDDPLAKDGPWLIDRFTWNPRPGVDP